MSRAKENLTQKFVNQNILLLIFDTPFSVGKTKKRKLKTKIQTPTDSSLNHTKHKNKAKYKFW